MNEKILLVEDDPNFGMLLKDYLELNEYQIFHAKDGKEGLRMFKENSYDLCVFDVMMPKMDGFTLAEEVRKINQKVPIFFLTAKSMKEDVLKGYTVGGDDYINKPFDTQVFLAKVQNVLRRSKTEAEHDQKAFSFGIFEFDSKLRELKSPISTHRLSPKENELLKMLLLHREDLMPREKALHRIWKEDNYFTSRSMDVYIAKIRKILKEDPNLKIMNIHGEGFRLTEGTEN